jgi:hypothetical protein
MIIHWINLTNGLQAIPDYGLTDYRVMRLQSTYCEQKLWNDILMTIPDEFLFRASLGDECRVYDYGANRIVPRSIWQGLELVRYVLMRKWFNEIVFLEGRQGRSMFGYFDRVYTGLPKRVLTRLTYFEKYLIGKPLLITSVTSPTIHDGTKEWFVKCLEHDLHYGEYFRKVSENRQQ